MWRIKCHAPYQYDHVQLFCCHRAIGYRPTRKFGASVPERTDLGFKCWRWLSHGTPRPSDPVYRQQQLFVLDLRVSRCSGS
jgi:hypothetical protein